MKTKLGSSVAKWFKRLWSLALLAGLLAVAPAWAFAAPSEATNKAEVERLVKVLSFDAGEKEKADACRELARIGDKEAVAALAALLSNESLSHMARYGLETIPSSAVDKAFREALGKLQGNLLVGVIGSIGVRRDPKAVKPLTKLLVDPDPDVAQAAARSLGSIGDDSASKSLLKALPGVTATNRLAFCEGLFRCAERLSAEGSNKRAVEIYDQVRNLQSLPQVRMAAWRGAILARGEKGLPLLEQALRSDDFSLFVIGLRISAEMPSSEVTRAMVADYPRLSSDAQLLLTGALGKRGDPGAMPALLNAAKVTAKPLRIAAIHAIAEIGQPSAVPTLAALIGDPDQDIAQAAQEALGGLQGKEADDAVMTMLTSADSKRRMTGMDLVVRRRMIAGIPKLLAASNDLDLKIRLYAAKRLAEICGPAQIPSLLRMLDRASTPEDVEAAEQALTAASVKAPKPDACATELAASMPKMRTSQQAALLRVLTAVGGTTALDTVRNQVENRDMDTRAVALRCLCSWSSDDAAPYMLALLRRGASPSDSMLLLRGFLRLAALPDLTPEKRLAMCRDVSALVQRGEEKKLLLGVLGGVASADALALIAPYTDESATKQEGLTAMVSVCEKLMQGNEAAKSAGKVAEQLERVTASITNEDLAKRAQALLEQARTKAAK